MTEWDAAKSDTTNIDTSMTIPKGVDSIFTKLIEENPNTYSIWINYPDIKDNASVIKAIIYKKKGKYHNSDYYDFDRYSLQVIEVEGPYSGKYTDASFRDKLRRMNYEIHICSIAGTPGRILVFLVAIFGSSLPITGLYIYISKLEKRQKRQSRYIISLLALSRKYILSYFTNAYSD